MNLRTAFVRFDRLFMQAAAIAACIFLAIAVVAGFWQVLSRFILSNPSIWSEALVRLSLIWMVMIGLGVALRQGALVSIDIAESAARGIVRKVIHVAILLSNLTLLGTLLWFGWTMAQRVRFQEMAGLEISIAYGYAAIPIGCFCGIVGTIAHFFDRRSSELENAT
jgi:TRAP-type C4-dicarboxylate transport system permease small subunit